MNERLLTIWKRMLDACTDETHADYAAHGAMGIGVCESWQHDSAAFKVWAEEHEYADDRFLIRIRINDDFMPQNCCWVNEKVFQRYSQFIRPVPGEGTIRPLGNWLTDRRCIVDINTFSRLLAKGWSVERILTKPPKKQRGRKYPFALAGIPIGMVFGRLTVIGLPDIFFHRSGWKQYFYPCSCSCGTKEVSVNAVCLIYGNTVSCKCYWREQLGKATLVHGDARRLKKVSLYNIWMQMVNYCNKPKYSGYLSYGGRGIAVCLAWQMEYKVFRSWALVNGYQKGLHIERHDQNGDFTPENCFFTDDAPLTAQSRLLTLDGETKTLTKWSRDPRSSVSRYSISWRIGHGWQIEEAIQVGPRNVAAPMLLTACGETRLLKEWVRDPRCSVTRKVILLRLRAGWDAEDAVTIPSGGKQPGIVAFQEQKSAAAWSRDPRSVVSEEGLRHRLRKGWEAEKAITTPMKSTGQHLEAFGEWKTIVQWADDPRCCVPLTTIYQRLDLGWSIEDALQTTTGGRTKIYEAFGEQKSLTEWAEDSRCCVPFPTLSNRLRAGWTPEAALATIPFGNNKKYEAFGEEKLLLHWSKDNRCIVPLSTLNHRVKNGWTLVEALTTPARGKK